MLTDRELATVLWALRRLQNALDTEDQKGYVHFEEHDPLTSDEIDALCERLNCQPEQTLQVRRRC